jgi:hypothetical protein
MPLATALYYLQLSTPYIALGAFVVSIIAVGYAIALTIRFKRLALGRAGSLEESIAILTRESKEAKEFRAELERYLKLAEVRLRTSVRGVGVVRFNPFTAQGGNQSFCAAFLDERGSGVVLSTLYARDRVGVYAKPVDNGSSSFELTEEEKEAIQKAKAAAQNKK